MMTKVKAIFSISKRITLASNTNIPFFFIAFSHFFITIFISYTCSREPIIIIKSKEFFFKTIFSACIASKESLCLFLPYSIWLLTDHYHYIYPFLKKGNNIIPAEHPTSSIDPFLGIYFLINLYNSSPLFF